MPRTVKGKLLLGWMPEAEALDFLLKRCVFSDEMTEQRARETWLQYKQKVDALPPRACAIPAFQKMSEAENGAAVHFRNMPRPQSQEQMNKIVKVNVGDFVVHQFFVVTERSADYTRRMRDEKERIKICLGQDPQTPAQNQVGPLTTIILPHFEYDVLARISANTLNVNLAEWPRFISAVRLNDRLLLWGGYHRSYATLSHAEPEGAVEPPLVTLITSPLTTAFLGAASNRPIVRDCVLGARPALLRDFLDDGLAMSVSIRKQRRELRIDSSTRSFHHIYVDEES